MYEQEILKFLKNRRRREQKKKIINFTEPSKRRVKTSLIICIIILVVSLGGIIYSHVEYSKYKQDEEQKIPKWIIPVMVTSYIIATVAIVGIFYFVGKLRTF